MSTPRFVVAIVAILGPIRLLAQCEPGAPFELVPNNFQAFDRLGSRVAIDNDVAAVSIDRDEKNPGDDRAVYVFRRTQDLEWKFEQTIRLPGVTRSNYFGFAVQVSGDELFIGSAFESNFHGAVYVYKFDHGKRTWVLAQRLSLTNPSFSAFGNSIAVDGDTLLIGAYFDSRFTSQGGVAHIFERDLSGQWVQGELLFPSSPNSTAWFGFDVAIEQNIAVISAPEESLPDRFEAGVTYIFERNSGGWQETQRLVPEDLSAHDDFGYSVAIHDGQVFAGRRRDDANGADSGSIMVFENDGAEWKLVQTLYAPFEILGEFGTDISVSGDLLISGEPYGGPITQGAVHLFFRHQGVWQYGAEILPASGNVGDFFGRAVAMDGTICVAGAPNHDPNAVQLAGAVYIIPINLDDLDYDGIVDICDNCTNASNPDQTDLDEDTFGDLCDNCPVDANLDQADRDADGVGDICDGCPDTPNGDQADIDGDTVQDVCDLCPDAPNLQQSGTLLSPDGNPVDKFGSAVSVSGDYAVVGVPGDDEAGADAGAAIVYRWDGTSWVYFQKLTAFPSEATAEFGHSVAINDSAIAVGAWLEDAGGASRSGAVYTYRFDGSSWLPHQRLTQPTSTVAAHFGIACAMDDNRLVVGADLGRDAGLVSGSVYVFQFDGAMWQFEQALTATGATSSSYFGRVVSIESDRIAIGSPGNNQLGGSAGAAYIFENDAGVWIQRLRLLPADGGPGDSFGASIALSGDRVLIGAPGRDILFANSGSAFVFEHESSMWSEVVELTAFRPKLGENFGASVALRDNVAFVGAQQLNASNPLPGYIQKLIRVSETDWSYQGVLRRTGNDAADGLGSSFTVDDEWKLIAGLPLQNGGVGEAAIYNVQCGVRLIGDLNCDGALTVSDIGPFVLALTNPDQYAIDYPDCDINNANINGDGGITVSDIGPFVTLLIGS